jgi:hypothetical protein
MEIIKSYEFKKAEVCKRCGRKLKNNQSRLLGYGPGCYKKMMNEKYKKFKGGGLF